MNEENHMGWKLVSGVRHDVTTLFKKFANSNSVRFEDFCKVWKEINFSLIYSNRVSFMEIVEFTEELLQIVKEYLSSVYEIRTRVAALYALYGLYFKQPIREAAKIRFTKTEWEEVCNLIENSKKAEHFDIVFIFTKLYVYGAFTFVATIRPAGLERGFKKYYEKRSALSSKVSDVELLYRPLVSEKLVNSLVKLESLYCRKKSELLGDKNLVFIDGKFAESLKEELENYSHKMQYRCKNLKNSVQGQANNETGSSNEQSNDTEGGAETTQSAKSSRRGRRKKLNEKPDCDDVSSKKKRFNKKQLELIAKNKAEVYIRKLQEDNGLQGIKEENLNLFKLAEFEPSE